LDAAFGWDREWHFARVGIDYHAEVAGFLYSVPHQGCSTLPARLNRV
jgi:hypothetical protein